MGSQLVIDLSDARRDFERQAGAIWQRGMVRLLMSIRREWPRDTGRSAEGWAFNGRQLSNGVPYTEHIRHGGGLATDTVLTPLIESARRETWKE